MKRIYSAALLAAFLMTGCQRVVTITEDESAPDKSPELLGLAWHSGIGTAEQVMSGYRLEERNEGVSEDGQLLTLLEYDDVQLYETPCDVTLSFGDTGLTSLHYHDDDTAYRTWQERLTGKFGAPAQENDAVTVWNDPPIDGTSYVYLFRQEDDVRISLIAE